VVHVNGNGTAPAPFDWKHPISTELADYWESLDKGRRTFRTLDKHIRLDLVHAALCAFLGSAGAPVNLNSLGDVVFPPATATRHNNNHFVTADDAAQIGL
jgi:hypothetical protein